MGTELETPAIPPARFARRAGAMRVTANANIFEPRLINAAPERGLINLSYCREAGNVRVSGTGSDCWKTLLQIQYSLSVIKSVDVTRSADSGLIWTENNLYALGKPLPSITSQIRRLEAWLCHPWAINVL